MPIRSSGLCPPFSIGDQIRCQLHASCAEQCHPSFVAANSLAVVNLGLSQSSTPNASESCGFMNVGIALNDIRENPRLIILGRSGNTSLKLRINFAYRTGQLFLKLVHTARFYVRAHIPLATKLNERS